MADPKTRLSDYITYRTELEALENTHLAGDISDRTLLAESKALLKKHPRVHPEDIYRFGDYRAFTMFILGEMGATLESLALIKHEFAHYVKVKDRGTDCRFGCVLLLNDAEGASPDARALEPFIEIYDIDRKDAKAAVEAVDDPSPRDKDLSDRL